MNRRVPIQNLAKRYTIIGDGKVAKHFAHYFSLLEIEFNTWSRKQSSNQYKSTLKSSIEQSDIVLLLISDGAIESFVEEYSFLKQKQLVHFSGSLSLDNIFGCHPLMTFSDDAYSLETYQRIPFVCDQEVYFKSLFPQFENPSYKISKENKAYYHAMCVMAGNFTQTLMRETSKQLSNELDLPEDVLFPYLLQNTLNFIQNPQNSSTGPIQRNDFTTVSKHLQALKGDPLESIYQSFVTLNSNRVVDFSQPNRGLKSTPQQSVKLEVI